MKLLESSFLYPNADGDYYVFNKYILTKTGKVTVIATSDIYTFTDTRYAISWIIFDATRQLDKSMHLKSLDIELSMKLSAKDHLAHAIDSREGEEREISAAKLSMCEAKISQIKQAMDWYAGQAYIWQNQFESTRKVAKELFNCEAPNSLCRYRN
jgi:hypothetical protein